MHSNVSLLKITALGTDMPLKQERGEELNKHHCLRSNSVVLNAMGNSKPHTKLPLHQKLNQSRANGPINAHLTIAQVMPKYKHNNEKQEALL